MPLKYPYRHRSSLTYRLIILKEVLFLYQFILVTIISIHIMISLNGGVNMSFNHRTSHLSGQQQAIIRQREKNDEIRKQESKKQNDIICKPIESNGDYRAVVFEQGVRKLLE